MSRKTPRQDLTIYLLKESVDDLKKAIKNPDIHVHKEINLNPELIVNLYIKKSYSNPPKWANFFHGTVDKIEFGKNSSTGAVLFIPLKNRYFAISFGQQGRYIIDSTYLEMGFGLRVALNSIDEHSLKSIDKSSFEVYPKQYREQSGKEAELQYFGIDVEKDLLRAVTGRPVDKEIGYRITGMDALRVNAEVKLETLEPYLDKVLSKYEDTSYKKSFEWVDHIGEIKDKGLIEKLDEQLIQKISDLKTDNIWLAVPEIINWERVAGFTHTGSRNVRHYDVRITDFLKSIGDLSLSKELLLRRKIQCVDDDFLPLFERAVYYFIYGEIVQGNNTYLINNGKWYNVNRDFVGEINSSYASITRYNSELPVYKDETEPKYNTRVAKEYSDNFVLMDANNIKLPGRPTPVEFCDLYSKNKELIHIKRYTGSSNLSHLFNQGVVSGELLQMERRFRELVNKELPESHKIENVEKRPLAGQYKVVYAIISEYDEALEIPFFSKISLKNAVRRLESIGFNVELAKISVDEMHKKRNVIKTKK